MTLYGYARVSVREPEDKNLDLQGTWGLADHGAPGTAMPGPRPPTGRRKASWYRGPKP